MTNTHQEKKCRYHNLKHHIRSHRTMSQPIQNMSNHRRRKPTCMPRMLSAAALLKTLRIAVQQYAMYSMGWSLLKINVTNPSLLLSRDRTGMASVRPVMQASAAQRAFTAPFSSISYHIIRQKSITTSQFCHAQPRHKTGNKRGEGGGRRKDTHTQKKRGVSTHTASVENMRYSIM